MIHGVVPDVGLTYLPSNSNEGIKLKLPKLKGNAHTKKLAEHSLMYHGVRLYNLLPAQLRATISDEEQPSVDTFKRKLDELLWLIPDEPGQNKGNRVRAAESNSILHQFNYKKVPPKATADAHPEPRR